LGCDCRKISIVVGSQELLIAQAAEAEEAVAGNCLPFLVVSVVLAVLGSDVDVVVCVAAVDLADNAAVGDTEEVRLPRLD
jgi:hypothetical protein